MAEASSAGSDSGSSQRSPEAVLPLPQVAATTVKIPPFWPADPEVWFLQIEAIFNTKRVTAQKTKYEHLVGSLSHEVATEVRDLLIQPPAQDPYTTLKNAISKRTTDSQQKRLQKLLNLEELGDRKPTQFLRKMQQLIGESAQHTAFDLTMLKELFLQRLPANVRMILASTPDLELQAMASLADRIMEVAPVTSTVYASAPAPISKESLDRTPRLEQLENSINALTAEVSRLRGISPPRHRSSSRSRHRSSSRSRYALRNNVELSSGLCWYHQRFGSKSTKCTQPCTWSGNEQTGRQ